MKAAQLIAYEDIEHIQVGDIEKPSLRDGQVLVEVSAASLNPFDTTVRKGYVKDSIPLQLPVTLGGDIAGIVRELSPSVTGLEIGDNVYGQASVVAGNSGAFAEFAATSANQVAKMPSNIDFQSAATMPLVGVSAMQAIIEHINLQPQQKIFIHGGAGGIGSIAIQIAKHLGAYVATTASGEGIGRVTQLSADEVIDYKVQPFTEVLQEFDAVFDTVGGDDFEASFDVLKPRGIAVSMIASFNEAAAREHQITALTQATKVSTKALDALRELIEANVITPNVGTVFSLEDIRAAFATRESGAQGKVVIDMKI